jgi:hypothetical protein
MEVVVKYLLGILLIGSLFGCATAYQPMGSTGGFYHQKKSENFYVIGFRGNGFTNAKRANDFAKLRAAEIGSKLGFTHFAIEGSVDKSSREIVNTGSTTTTSGNAYGYGNSVSYYGTSTTTNNSMPVYRPGIDIGVLYFEGIPEGRYLEIFVIEEVLSELKAKYGISP